MWWRPEARRAVAHGPGLPYADKEYRAHTRCYWALQDQVTMLNHYKFMLCPASVLSNIQLSQQLGGAKRRCSSPNVQLTQQHGVPVFSELYLILSLYY